MVGSWRLHRPDGAHRSGKTAILINQRSRGSHPFLPPFALLFNLFIASDNPGTGHCSFWELFLIYFKMRQALWAALSLWADTSLASYGGNLNYRSPSLSHAGLGIDMPRLQSRMIQKRDGKEYDNEDLSFTHGVASVSTSI